MIIITYMDILKNVDTMSVASTIVNVWIIMMEGYNDGGL